MNDDWGATRLHDALKAALPVLSVGVNNLGTDTTQWPATNTWHARPDVLVRVEWSQQPTAQQEADADAIVQAHDPTPPTLHELAVAAFRDLQAEAALRDRAIALTAKDEINLLRQWITSFKAAVAGAGSLAQLKTAVAALPNMPDRTAVQAKASIEAKINGGEAD